MRGGAGGVRRARRAGGGVGGSGCTVAVASQGKAMAHQAVSEISDHGAQENSRMYPDDLDDEDEGEGCPGYKGFVSSGTSGRCEHCGMSLVRDLDSSVQPWNVRSTEVVNAVSSFDEVSQQRAMELRSTSVIVLVVRRLMVISESAGV